MSLSGQPLWESHATLSSFIRQHLPATSASILAEPIRTAGSSSIDWCSDISGQPVPFAALGAADKAKVERLLADRLQALRALAERHSGTPTATLLTAAAVEPPEDAVYVINGQPVIVGWGRHGSRASSAPRPATPAPVQPAPVQVRRGFPWWLVGALAGLALLAALLWWLWPLARPGMGGTEDRLAALTAEESALNAEIIAAEDELRGRLGACTTAQTLPQSVAPETPKAETPKAEAPAAAAPVPPEAVPPQPVPPTPEAKKTETPPPPQSAPAKPLPQPQAQAQPQPQAQPQAKPQSASACPPPRKKWQAPELVLLLDASGSMRLNAGVSQEEVQALIRRARRGDRAALGQLKALEGGGHDRLSTAKKAVASMVSTLPGDMDVGLVVFGHCQGAENHKFFSPAERPRLLSLLDGIRPMEGTPLARGIERAGSIVDGRSVPATLVVVTDGEDSCGRDPCAAARELKAAKPLITINVVDVNGLGEGRCIAEATGGRVLPMTSPAELPELVQKASGEQPVPPGCG